MLGVCEGVRKRSQVLYAEARFCDKRRFFNKCFGFCDEIIIKYLSHFVKYFCLNFL